jgi:hypothetical protein
VHTNKSPHEAVLLSWLNYGKVFFFLLFIILQSPLKQNAYLLNDSRIFVWGKNAEFAKCCYLVVKHRLRIDNCKNFENIEIFLKLLPNKRIAEANIRSLACIRRFMIEWEHYLWTICPFAHTWRNNTNIYMFQIYESTGGFYISDSFKSSNHKHWY